MKTPYYRWEEVEALAGRLLRRLEALHGEPLALPVDIDAIGEQLLGLSWLYELIPEPRGTTILAALDPERRLVVLNERHLEIFGRNEGLERFTKAHELGHWVLHAADARRQAPDARADREAAPCGAMVQLASGVWRLAPPPQAARHWQEIQANWFAAALLMPPAALRRAVAEVDVAGWPGRYTLRDRCGVSISALNARLRRLGYPDVRSHTR